MDISRSGLISQHDIQKYIVVKASEIDFGSDYICPTSPPTMEIMGSVVNYNVNVVLENIINYNLGKELAINPISINEKIQN
ncbi:hypothetical protein BB561_004123 [Smittium simulii]|uniref:EF-hand domain-containing protein n=1 Tax=Smittium simulii TaxID=133385 RepID=A0A2T9YHW2_9FUNG|nr:hypothetical protein BB561_004123 [Smittium simulii]